MKNLELLQLENKFFPDSPFNEVKHFHITSNQVFYISHNVLYKYDCETDQSTELCFGEFDKVLAMKFLAIEEKICIVTNDTIYTIDPKESDAVISTPLGDNCSAVSWSPGEDLVAMVADTGGVKTYGVNYENGMTFERGCSSIEADVPDTVYVGWGSKDTQFRGSEGKLKKQPEKDEIDPFLSQIPSISWRGNGEMFAVNYFKDDKRQFLVFETPCTPLYRSEHVTGLQPIIAWRPTGNMIATVGRQQNKHHIVVFEKNGQKRFQFELALGDDVTTVKDVKWSPCAHILTVLTDSSLHLLTCSNYKWYEKQRLIFTDMLAYDWLETSRFVFVLRAVTSRDIVTYAFRQHVDASSANCSVINGSLLQITNFDDVIIPPPLYSVGVAITNAINHVTINKHLAALVDSRNHLFIYDWAKQPDRHLFTYDLSETIDSRFPLAFNHFHWEGCAHVRFVHDAILYKIDIHNGDVTKCDALKPPVRFLTENHLTDAVKVVQQKIEDRSVTFTMTNGGHFYMDDVMLSDVTNSFLIKTDYLILTTKLNELYCVRLKQLLKSAKLPDNNRRNIEQGAILVAAITNTSQVVVQMPRGNLETISCRLVAIDTLDCLLAADEWEQALKFVRLEKLNANLMFDLNPERFFANLKQFVMAARNLNELGNFCLELEPPNVLDTLYKNWGEVKVYPEKIKTICNHLLSLFDDLGYVAYITSIMIINLHHFTVRDALIYLQDLLRRSVDDPTLKQPLNQALNTLKTYNSDQDKLFTESLLLYDLNLARFIASKCQMDPRVYEPQLDELANLPEVERRFHINLYAKQMTIAIAYLLRMPHTTSEQIRAFILNNNVSRDAYETCPNTNEHYRTVGVTFAEHLSRKGCHNDAAIVYRKAGCIQQAVDEYKMALNWREVLNLTPEAERKQTAFTMADRLLKYDRFKEAAILYEHYALDYVKSAQVLLKGRLYEDALHVANKYECDVSIVPILTEHKDDLMEKLTDLYETFEKHRLRLADVRENKRTRTNDGCCGNEDNDLFSDAGSTTTKSSRSHKSTLSSKNRRKEQRKKQDLRRGGLYEDIALIRALYLTIKEFWSRRDEIERICVLLMQESDLNPKEIRKIYDFYKEKDFEVRKSLNQIWPPCLHQVAGQPLLHPDDAFLLENIEHLDFEFRVAPSGWKALNLGFFNDPLL